MTTSNFLLRLLPEAAQGALLSHAEDVELIFGHTLFQQGDPADHVWFVQTGMISAVATVDDEERVEVGLIGREGLGGLSTVLGAGTMANTGIVQLAGRAARVRAVDLQALMAQFDELRPVLLRYAEAMFIQVSQTAACNARHDIDQRLARWILASLDRAGNGELMVTHDFLAWMLGVRRPGVTGALHILEGAGAIRAQRGKVVLKDRIKLYGGHLFALR